MACSLLIIELLAEKLVTLTNRNKYVKLFGIENYKKQKIFVTACCEDINAFATGLKLLAIASRDKRTCDANIEFFVHVQNSFVQVYKSNDLSNSIAYQTIARLRFDSDFIYLKLNYTINYSNSKNTIDNLRQIKHGEYSFYKGIDFIINKDSVFVKEECLNPGDSINSFLITKSDNNIYEFQVYVNDKNHKSKNKNSKYIFEFNKLAIVNRSELTKNIYNLLQKCMHENLELLTNYLEKYSDSNELEIYALKPDDFLEYVFIVYPSNKNNSELDDLSQYYFQKLCLSSKTAVLKKEKILEDIQSAKIINIHKLLNNPKNSTYLVKQSYEYYHYGHDNEDDNGWGCSYRSFQTIFSFFKLNGYTSLNVPSIRDIQMCLVMLGDKELDFVGSRKWIGSIEISYCLDSIINIQSEILHLPSGTSIDQFADKLCEYFQNHGAPIMIGSGYRAHTILGVSKNVKSNKVKYLVLDPHYEGDDNPNEIFERQYCGWKTADFWKGNNFSNLCLPFVP